MTEKKATGGTRGRKSSAVLAREIAQTADWLATVLDGREPAEDLRSALERAHDALRVIPAHVARNQICAALHSLARGAGSNPVAAARGFIETTFSGPEFRIDGRSDRLRDETITAALEAWGRGRGAPKKTQRVTGAALDKWHATAKLLKECGVPVTAESIRKGWEGRSK
jgi:hypothetical protein